MFPFPFLAAADIAPAEAVVAEEMSEASAPVLRQLLHEVRAWQSAPAAERRILGELPDVAQLPDEIVERVGRVFQLLREEPGQDTASAIALGLAWTAEWHGIPTPERMRELFPAFTLAGAETSRAERERNEDFAASLENALRAREDGAPESPVRALIRGR